MGGLVYSSLNNEIIHFLTWEFKQFILGQLKVLSIRYFFVISHLLRYCFILGSNNFCLFKLSGKFVGQKTFNMSSRGQYVSPCRDCTGMKVLCPEFVQL